MSNSSLASRAARALSRRFPKTRFVTFPPDGEVRGAGGGASVSYASTLGGEGVAPREGGRARGNQVFLVPTGGEPYRSQKTDRGYAAYPPRTGVSHKHVK